MQHPSSADDRKQKAPPPDKVPDAPKDSEQDINPDDLLDEDTPVLGEQREEEELKGPDGGQ